MLPQYERRRFMLYKAEVHHWNENIPDDGIWDGGYFPDLTEANSEEEAISLCIEYFMEEADWSGIDHDPDSIEVKPDCIEYINGDGYRCAVVFRAERIIVNNLCVLRRKSGMTQKDLADRTGIKVQKISWYECTDDLRNITLWNALRIAEALNCTVEDIVLKQL